MTVEFDPQGVCARHMTVSAENGVVTDLKVFGGCDGNLQGISRLVVGMPVEDAIERLSGIDCNGKGTSCPDQLAKAIDEVL